MVGKPFKRDYGWEGRGALKYVVGRREPNNVVEACPLYWLPLFVVLVVDDNVLVRVRSIWVLGAW